MHSAYAECQEIILEYSKKIRELCKELGLTQENLAQLLEIDQASVSRYHKGKTPDQFICVLLAGLSINERDRLEWLTSRASDRQIELIERAVSLRSSTASTPQPLNPDGADDKVTLHVPTVLGQQYTQKLLRIMQSPFWTALKHNLDAFYRAAEESQELERLRSGGDISRVEATSQEEADVVRSRLKGSLDEDSRKTEARIKDAARPKPIPVPRGKR